MAALICLLLLQIHVFASATGIDSLTPMPQDEAERVLANLNVKGYSDFPVQRPIECMAISEDGKIAVAFQIMGGYAVCLMDTDGVIISGFTFQNSGVVTLTLGRFKSSCLFCTWRLCSCYEFRERYPRFIRCIGRWRAAFSQYGGTRIPRENIPPGKKRQDILNELFKTRLRG